MQASDSLDSDLKNAVQTYYSLIKSGEDRTILDHEHYDHAQYLFTEIGVKGLFRSERNYGIGDQVTIRVHPKAGFVDFERSINKEDSLNEIFSFDGNFFELVISMSDLGPFICIDIFEIKAQGSSTVYSIIDPTDITSPVLEKSFSTICGILESKNYTIIPSKLCEQGRGWVNEFYEFEDRVPKIRTLLFGGEDWFDDPDAFSRR